MIYFPSNSSTANSGRHLSSSIHRRTFKKGGIHRFDRYKCYISSVVALMVLEANILILVHGTCPRLEHLCNHRASHMSAGIAPGGHCVQPELIIIMPTPTTIMNTIAWLYIWDRCLAKCMYPYNKSLSPPSITRLPCDHLHLHS